MFYMNCGKYPCSPFVVHDRPYREGKAVHAAQLPGMLPVMELLPMINTSKFGNRFSSAQLSGRVPVMLV